MQRRCQRRAGPTRCTCLKPSMPFARHAEHLESLAGPDDGLSACRTHRAGRACSRRESEPSPRRSLSIRPSSGPTRTLRAIHATCHATCRCLSKPAPIWCSYRACPRCTRTALIPPSRSRASRVSWKVRYGPVTSRELRRSSVSSQHRRRRSCVLRTKGWPANGGRATYGA